MFIWSSNTFLKKKNIFKSSNLRFRAIPYWEFGHFIFFSLLQIPIKNHSIFYGYVYLQILTGTVRKICFGGLPGQSYCTKWLYFPDARAVLWGNIVMRKSIIPPAPPKRDILYVPVDICYIRWSKSMVASKFEGALQLPQSLVTKLGVCIQNEQNTNMTAFRAIYFHDVPLSTTVYSDYLSGAVFLKGSWWYCCCRLYFLLNWSIFPDGQYTCNSVSDCCLCTLNSIEQVRLSIWDGNIHLCSPTSNFSFLIEIL